MLVSFSYSQCVGETLYRNLNHYSDNQYIKLTVLECMGVQFSSGSEGEWETLVLSASPTEGHEGDRVKGPALTSSEFKFNFKSSRWHVLLEYIRWHNAAVDCDSFSHSESILALLLE